MQVTVLTKTTHAGHFAATVGYLLEKSDAQKQMNSCRYIWSASHFSQNLYKKKNAILLITNRQAKIDSRHYVKIPNWPIGHERRTKPKGDHLHEELKFSGRIPGELFGKPHLHLLKKNDPSFMLFFWQLYWNSFNAAFSKFLNTCQAKESSMKKKLKSTLTTFRFKRKKTMNSSLTCNASFYWPREIQRFT